MAARAQQGLAQPFKHADALKAATLRSSQITIEMQNRQKAVPGGRHGGRTCGRDHRGSGKIDRIARASFPTPSRAQRAEPRRPRARRPPPAPTRDTDGSREDARRIAQRVSLGETIATIGDEPLLAPLDGILRGLVHDGVRVEQGAKVLEVDPRGDPANVSGIGERPRRVAEGVLAAIGERL